MMMTTESLQIPRGKHKASNPWAVGISPSDVGSPPDKGDLGGWGLGFPHVTRPSEGLLHSLNWELGVENGRRAIETVQKSNIRLS